MKNKKKTYLLLVIVIIIWALLIYRFFSFASEGKAVLNQQKQMPTMAMAVKPRDTFSVNVNYRDPFLGKMYKAEKAVRPGRNKAKKVQPVVWPAVIYKGIVSDTKNKNKVFMVIIEGRTYMMKENETEQEITLKKGNRESIEVKYMGETFSILIQQ